MTRSNYDLFNKFMLSNMKDTAHDKNHIYRVLYVALDIAKHEPSVDYDILICSCLLHDIGRQDQLEKPHLCHAKVGSQKAYQFLLSNGFDISFAESVQSCILSHRFRSTNLPESLESKILFDSDKIDAAGCLGISRTLIYLGQINHPLYSTASDGDILDGLNDAEHSFFKEFKNKLEDIHSKIFTTRGKEIAHQRKQSAINFYNTLFNEVKLTHDSGKKLLENHFI